MGEGICSRHAPYAVWPVSVSGLLRSHTKTRRCSEISFWNVRAMHHYGLYAQPGIESWLTKMLPDGYGNLSKGYRPCRRPLMRKQSRGMSNAFCLYIFHPHFPKIQMSRGYVNSIIWRDAFCLFMDIWCYFFKVFCIKRFNDARDHGMARKVKRPGHVAFGTHQKKTEKKLPPAKKLRRVGLITAPCPNSGNVQVASNKENLCAT